MHDVWIALITVCGSALTAVIVAAATLRASRDERKAQRVRDLEVATAEFLAALTKAVSRLTALPHLDPHHPVVVYAEASKKVSDKLFPGRSYMREQQRLREVLGERPFLEAERVVDTASRLRVLGVGPELSKAMDDALDYLITLGSDRSQKQLDLWPDLRKVLIDAIAAERATPAPKEVRP